MTKVGLNRRMFLKAAAAVGSTVGFAPSRLLGGPPCRSVPLSNGDLQLLSNSLSDPSGLVLPTDSSFGTAKLLYNRNLGIPDPTFIVKARSTEDVVNTVNWCREREINPRIRSGGHSYAGYSSGATVVLDLREMNGVENDGDGVSAIDAGANLGQVYAGLRCDEQRSLPSGTCAGVGISGISTAGGFGFHMREHGLTLDRVEKAEVVLANGDVVMASNKPDEHPDLFWALLGGGSGSYGVVTRWWFNTIEFEDLSRATGNWDWNDLPQVFAAWQEWITTLPNEVYVNLITRVNPGSAPSFLVQAIGPNRKGVDLVALVEDLASQSGVPTSDKVVKTDISWWPTPCPANPVRGSIYGLRKSRLSEAAVSDDAMLGLMANFEDRLKNEDLHATSGKVILDALGGAVAERASDATSWVHRDARFCSQFITNWNSMPESQSAADENQAWLRRSYDEFAPYCNRGCYQGYWDADIVDWPDLYYGENFPRLREVKTAYDPENFFRFQRSIPPLG